MLANSAELRQTGTMPGLLYKVANYPAAVYMKNDTHSVKGEVYALKQPASIWTILDDYEECSPAFPTPHEYQRCQRLINLADGNSLLCWVYLYNRPIQDLEWIASGNYRPYLIC